MICQIVSCWKIYKKTTQLIKVFALRATHFDNNFVYVCIGQPELWLPAGCTFKSRQLQQKHEIEKSLQRAICLFTGFSIWVSHSWAEWSHFIRHSLLRSSILFLSSAPWLLIREQVSGQESEVLQELSSFYHLSFTLPQALLWSNFQKTETTTHTFLVGTRFRSVQRQRRWLMALTVHSSIIGQL